LFESELNPWLSFVLQSDILSLEFFYSLKMFLHRPSAVPLFHLTQNLAEIPWHVLKHSVINQILFVQNHFPDCPRYPLSCEKCGKENIPRNEMQDHNEKECPTAELKCPFNVVGCPFEVQQAFIFFPYVIYGMQRYCKELLIDNDDQI